MELAKRLRLNITHIYREVVSGETIAACPVMQELTVIHCAALVYIKSKPDPRVFSVNVGGTGNIVKMYIEMGARLIYVNSVHAMPEPADDCTVAEIKDFSQDLVTGVYAKSKAEAAWLVLDAVSRRGLRAVILHPSGIIGSGNYGVTHTTVLVLAAMRGRLPAIVNGGYDFVNLRNVADGILSATENGRDGECYILSNRYVSIKELVDGVCRYSGAKKGKIDPADADSEACRLIFQGLL